MATPLITVGPGKEMESGVFPSVDALSAPFWHQGENVEFQRGGVVSSKGYTLLASLRAPGFSLAQAYIEGDQRVYASIDNEVVMVSSVTGGRILGTLPNVGRPYFEVFGSWLLVTNGIDPVHLWKNTGVLTPIAGSPSPIPFSRAKLLHRRDNHILAFNTNLGQNHYAWCSVSNPEDWVATPQNSAGDNFIRDLDSEIVAVRDIGKQVAVYSRETLGLVRFVGQPNVFAHDPAINGVGAVGADSVVQVGPMNFGLNRQGIFQTDGLSFTYLDEPAVSEVLDVANFDRGEFIRSYHNESLGSVIWFYDDLAGTRRGISYDYRKGVFKTLNMPITAALERQVFATPIALVGNSIVNLNSGEDALGSALSKWVRTKPLAGGEGTRWKYWSHLKMAGRWSAGARVKFGAVEDPTSSNIEWFSEQPLDFEVWVDRDCPFLVLEFRADGVGDYFSISQLQLMGIPGAEVSL